MVTIPEIRVGEPAVYGGMTVFPLFGGLPDGDTTIDYLLAHEAMASGTLAVREVSEAGSIHELLAENGGECPVLFVEGDELRGAKQNRAVSATILVAARSSTVIPVICTEWGRWGYSSRQFSSGMHLPPTLRRIIKEGAGANFTTRGRHRPDQLAMWQEIRRRHDAMRVSSRTGNLSDAADAHRERVDEVRARLPHVEGASGIAVALADKIVSLDVFDKPATLQKVWDRLISGLAMDSLEISDTGRQASHADILSQLYMLRQMDFRPSSAGRSGRGVSIPRCRWQFGKCPRCRWRSSPSQRVVPSMTELP